MKGSNKEVRELQEESSFNSKKSKNAAAQIEQGVCHIVALSFTFF
jgi:hypothetical protein